MKQLSKMHGLMVRIAVGVFGLLFIATLLLAIFNEKGVLQVHAQYKKLTAVESEVSKMDAENKQLSAEIQSLQHDPGTIEKIAREELKLVRPGEIVLVTPSENPPQPSQPPSR